jgi:hypothetical protein
VAGYVAPYEPLRDPGPERHIDVSRPGELVGIDCFYVGRLGDRGQDLAAPPRSTSPPRSDGQSS